MQHTPEEAAAIQEERKQSMLQEIGDRLSDIDTNTLPERVRSQVENGIKARDKYQADGNQAQANKIAEVLLQIPEVMQAVKQLMATPETGVQVNPEGEQDERLDEIKKHVEPMIEQLNKILELSKTEFEGGATTQALFEEQDYDFVKSRINAITQLMTTAQSIEDVRQLLTDFVQWFDIKLKSHIENRFRFFNGPYFGDNAPAVCRQQQAIYMGDRDKSNGVEDHIFAIGQELKR